MQMPVAGPKCNFLPLLIFKSPKPIPTLFSYSAYQPTFMAIGVSGAIPFVPFLAMMSPPAYRHDDTNPQFPNGSLKPEQNSVRSAFVCANDTQIRRDIAVL